MGENNFTLPNEVVIVKYIKRKKGMASGSHIGEDHVISGGMLEGSIKKFQAPLLKNGSIANVLTNEEKVFLENMTGLDLSVYKDFWYDHFVTLFKQDNRFDLSNPMDYISYKVLLANKNEIAPSWSERNKKLTYDFAITKEYDELNEDKKSFDSKLEAYKLYGKIEDDQDKLIGVLNILTNKPIASDTSLKWLQLEVQKILDKKPESFLNAVNDTSLETKILLNKAIINGYVKIKGNKYSTEDGLDLCENGQIATFENAVKYLNNPKNQNVRDLIEAKTLTTVKNKKNK
jgi:hypothetical protein